MLKEITGQPVEVDGGEVKIRSTDGRVFDLNKNAGLSDVKIIQRDRKNKFFPYYNNRGLEFRVDERPRKFYIVPQTTTVVCAETIEKHPEG